MRHKLTITLEVETRLQDYELDQTLREAALDDGLLVAFRSATLTPFESVRVSRRESGEPVLITHFIKE